MSDIKITNADRLNLKRMINMADDYQDNTDNIRKLKHSNLIRQDIMDMETLKKENSYVREKDLDAFSELCKSKCSFLFNNYTDIFNKLMKDELDLRIMSSLLEVLSKIENNEIDQQEGSFIVGTILKRLYVDSALKTAANLDKKREEHGEIVEEPVYVEPKQISWQNYKKML